MSLSDHTIPVYRGIRWKENSEVNRTNTSLTLTAMHKENAWLFSTLPHCYTIALIIDMQKEIDQQTAQLIKAEQETYRLFDRIHPESASILMEHFIRGKKTIDMGKSLCLSQRQIRRKLCEAIAELQKVFNEEEKGSLN